MTLTTRERAILRDLSARAKRHRAQVHRHSELKRRGLARLPEWAGRTYAGPIEVVPEKAGPGELVTVSQSGRDLAFLGLGLLAQGFGLAVAFTGLLVLYGLL